MKYITNRLTNIKTVFENPSIGCLGRKFSICLMLFLSMFFIPFSADATDSCSKVFIAKQMQVSDETLRDIAKLQIATQQSISKDRTVLVEKLNHELKNLKKLDTSEGVVKSRYLKILFNEFFKISSSISQKNKDEQVKKEKIKELNKDILVDFEVTKIEYPPRNYILSSFVADQENKIFIFKAYDDTKYYDRLGIMDITTQKFVLSDYIPKTLIDGFAFFNESKNVAVIRNSLESDKKSYIEIYSTRDGSLVNSMEFSTKNSKFNPNRILTSPDQNKLLVVGSVVDEVKKQSTYHTIFVDLKEFKILDHFSTSIEKQYISFSNDNRYLAVSYKLDNRKTNNESILEILDLEKKSIFNIKCKTNFKNVHFTKDGNYVLVPQTNQIEIYDLKSQKLHKTIRINSLDNAIRIDPDIYIDSAGKTFGLVDVISSNTIELQYVFRIFELESFNEISQLSYTLPPKLYPFDIVYDTSKNILITLGSNNLGESSLFYSDLSRSSYIHTEQFESSYPHFLKISMKDRFVSVVHSGIYRSSSDFGIRMFRFIDLDEKNNKKQE